MLDLKHMMDSCIWPWGLMMIPHRRKGDAEMTDLKDKIVDMARPLMLPVFTAALAVLGVSAGPIETLADNMQRMHKELTEASVRLGGVERLLDKESNQIASHLDSLDKRMRECELKIASRDAQIDSMAAKGK